MTKQEEFLKKTLTQKLSTLTADAQPEWGIMTAQHMVEHLSSLFLFTIEKIKDVSFFEEEKLQKNYDFLILNKQAFLKNVKLPGLESLQPLRFDSMDAAIAALQNLIEKFYAYFADDKNKKTRHPAIGLLNFEEWEWNHYAHAKHHLEQFGLIKND